MAQRMAQQGTGNVKQTLPHPRNMAQAGRGKIKGGTWMGTLIHALKKRLKEREKENRSRGAKPPNLLIIAPYGLASFCLHPCPFCLRLGSCTLTPSILTPCVYMQRQKKQASRRVKK